MLTSPAMPRPGVWSEVYCVEFFATVVLWLEGALKRCLTKERGRRRKLAVGLPEGQAQSKSEPLVVIRNAHTHYAPRLTCFSFFFLLLSDLPPLHSLPNHSHYCHQGPMWPSPTNDRFVGRSGVGVVKTLHRSAGLCLPLREVFRVDCLLRY